MSIKKNTLIQPYEQQIYLQCNMFNFLISESLTNPTIIATKIIGKYALIGAGSVTTNEYSFYIDLVEQKRIIFKKEENIK